jgi:hypothetical protein
MKRIIQPKNINCTLRYQLYSADSLGDACPNCSAAGLPCECMEDIVEDPDSYWIWLQGFRKFIRLGKKQDVMRARNGGT